jgi:hypothetical protein
VCLGICSWGGRAAPLQVTPHVLAGNMASWDAPALGRVSSVPLLDWAQVSLQHSTSAGCWYQPQSHQLQGLLFTPHCPTLVVVLSCSLWSASQSMLAESPVSAAHRMGSWSGFCWNSSQENFRAWNQTLWLSCLTWLSPFCPLVLSL